MKLNTSNQWSKDEITFVVITENKNIIIIRKPKWIKR